MRQRTLLGFRFDVARTAAMGNPVALVEGITSLAQGVNFGGQVGASQYAVSSTGLLAYIPQTAASLARMLVWIDRQGRETPVSISARAFVYPRISPDGSHVALDIRDEELDIWTWDLTRETLTRLTFDAATDTTPLWSPDGKRIAYSKAEKGIFWQAADGSGAPEQLTTSGLDVHAAQSFTPDGRRTSRPDGNLRAPLS